MFLYIAGFLDIVFYPKKKRKKKKRKELHNQGSMDMNYVEHQILYKTNKYNVCNKNKKKSSEYKQISLSHNIIKIDHSN